MTDTKNSNNGLLVISSRNDLTSAQLEKLRQTIEPLADEMGLRPLSLCDGLEVRAVVDYSALLSRLCVAVEALVAQGADDPMVGPSVAPSAPQGLNSRG